MQSHLTRQIIRHSLGADGPGGVRYVLGAGGIDRVRHVHAQSIHQDLFHRRSPCWACLYFASTCPGLYAAVVQSYPHYYD